MGFSRYCPSSVNLDLSNFVVQSPRGSVRRLSLADSLEFRNMGIQEAANMGIQNNHKHFSECKSVLPKMFARSGLVEKTPGFIWGNFRHFSMGRSIRKKKKMQKFRLFSLEVEWALFTRFGVICCCHFRYKKLAGELSVDAAKSENRKDTCSIFLQKHHLF